jgi:alkylation response protein AidB-like acyl-CoA dehydrogenase
MSYQAPIKEMLFVLKELAGIEAIAGIEGFEDYGIDTAAAVLEESGKFCSEVVAPLNWEGDKNPSSFKDGTVSVTAGFKEAYSQFVSGGWQGLLHPLAYGGQGLPKVISTPCTEMLNAANMSFALCPLLTDGAIEALLTAGSEELKKKFLPNMVSGKWTGTMNLTEPQAGSDLSMVRSKAVPQADGTYKIYGTKIYITYGEHDMAENIIHLVLARTPNAPEGVKGISLFVVPKFLVDSDGALGSRNDVHCVSIEHKLGIKASPTAVLQFGDKAGATAYLVGEENRGLEYMFIMMNSARFGVGMQGVAISDRAYQKAVSYAKERLQSRDLNGSDGAVAIIHHPDVKRLLSSMRAYTEGARALAYFGAALSDKAHFSPSEEDQKHNLALYEFLVPVIKGYSTEISIQVASMGVQVHGGMGFIEETGAAQYLRDSRILTIYEGTTAIQANDFVGRKTFRDKGAVAFQIAKMIAQTEAELAKRKTPACVSMLESLTDSRVAYEKVVEFIVANFKTNVKNVFAGSVPYLMLSGYLFTSWQMAKALMIAEDKLNEDERFYSAKIATAQFHAEHLLNLVPALAKSILRGGGSVNALQTDQF